MELIKSLNWFYLYINSAFCKLTISDYYKSCGMNLDSYSILITYYTDLTFLDKLSRLLFLAENVFLSTYLLHKYIYVYIYLI